MNLLFSKNHIWIKNEGNIATLGLSEYARDKLGIIMFLNLPEIGEQITKGENFGDVESVKTVSDLIAPISGEITDVNETALDEPEQVHEHPLETWLIQVQPELIPDDLLNKKEYDEYCRTL